MTAVLSNRGSTIVVMPPKRGPRYPLTKDGKRLLREAAERKGLGATALGKSCRCKHSLINQLFATDEAGGTKPVWSSHVVPRLCQVLEVPIWAVVEGLDEKHRAVLSALSLIAITAPDRYVGFVEDVVTRARDIAQGRGYVFREGGDGGAGPLAPRPTR